MNRRSHPRGLDRTSPLAGVALACALAATGCSHMKPHPLTDGEVEQRVKADQSQLYTEQEPVSGAISFEEAVARALKYNLDYRLKLMESAVASSLADLSKYDMLPNLVLAAGYADRSNITGSRSFQIIDDRVVEPATAVYTGGVEEQRKLASAEFSWNVLDLGVSYFRAKQQADQYLIAEERRRRVIQNILQDTRSAYWRAVGAQRLTKRAESLLAKVESALANSRAAEAQGLIPPREALGYQRMLLDAAQLLMARRQELEFARRELMALMNVPAGTQFTLVESAEPELLSIPENVEELESLALTNRPELREEDYRARITADEARRQLATLLPGISFNVGPQFDSNKYLYNTSWIDSAVKVSFNLVKALTYPAMRDVQQAQKQADDARRMALSMAVLTQVRVSVERYRLALHDLDIARDSSNVDQRLVAYAQAALETHTDAELELIRTETRALNSEYQRYAAYAAAQSAFGRIYNSVGLEVLPAKLETQSVRDLAQAVAANIASLESAKFQQAPLAAGASVPMRLALDLPGTYAERDAAAIRSAVEQALVRNGILLAGTADAAPVLGMKLAESAPEAGVRRAWWELALVDTGGTAGEAVRYASTLAEPANLQTTTEFAEAAVVANLRHIRHWLEPRVAP